MGNSSYSNYKFNHTRSRKATNFASQFGSLVKKIKDFANNLKTSIENESRMNDLKKIIEEQKEELSEFEKNRLR